MVSQSADQLGPASSWASQWQNLFYFEVGVFVFFSLLIFGVILYFAVKYRRRCDGEIPPPTRDYLPLEITWTVIPVGLCVVMFFWGTFLFVGNATPPAASMDIYVMGKQWMWKIQYPNGRRDINELHVPLGVPVRLIMSSEDVIHDFAIPAFRLKKDVLPRRITTEWFTATKSGRYHLFCDQYCGTSHSAMIGWVYVMEPAEYAQWLAGSAGGQSPADAGAELYQKYACITCHGTGRAPSFEGLFGTRIKLQNGQTVIADETFIQQCILAPNSNRVAGYPPIMPSFQGQLGADEILKLTAYIKSLAKPTASGGKVGTP
ncbi:MAG TPA: cytochrome c oxidase subunit II [Terriglobales bacterium]